MNVRCSRLFHLSPRPSRLQQVWDRCSWERVVTGFQVSRVFGPSLSPQGLCSLAPGVLRPWVWTQEGGVCVQQGDAPSLLEPLPSSPASPSVPCLDPTDPVTQAWPMSVAEDTDPLLTLPPDPPALSLFLPRLLGSPFRGHT